MENIVRKGEIAISPFLTIFLPYMIFIFHFECTLKCRLQFVSVWTSLKFCRNVCSNGLNTFMLSSANTFNLDQSKILLFGK